jgi:Photosynthesis system II assembly factor YCF48
MKVNPDRLDHLDADVVAAWFDGTLESGARAAAEAHAADCERCQAVLAAMVRTELAAPQPKPAWFRAPLRWALPLATATAAVAIWVTVDQDRPSPAAPPAPQVASQAPPAAEAPPSGLVDRTSPTASPAVPSRTVPDERTRQSTDKLTKSAAGRKVSAGAQSSRKEEEKTAPKLDAVENVEVRRQRLGQDSAAARAAEPRAALPPSTAVAETASARVQQQRADQRLGAGAGAYQAKDIASPDATVRWRIGSGGTIQRSADGGKTWVPQQSGVTSDLVAAAAPSADVCWVVGRGGIVLLSTDGATWRQIPFPEPIDLRSVTAIDARTASVTASDGRVFRTTDAGQTWNR